jgi:Serine dehydrogenase proteinase
MSTATTPPKATADNNTKRDRLIRKVEESLGIKVISYLTGDRPGLETQIGGDVIVRFRRHLEAIGDIDTLGLFLYTRGGDTNVPWRLVTLLREYCKKLVILVPFRAHSSGTLICMGADEIVVGRMGELTSIDPSVANPFNPPDPVNPMARVPISVEDVNAFRELAIRFGVKKDDPQESQVFLALASKVDPLALGNVQRTHNQIRKIAADLLRLHPPELGKEKIEKIVEMLTVGLFSHAHIINRKEAAEIGLNIKQAEKALDKLLWELFAEYSAEMNLDTPFNPMHMLPSQATSIHVVAKRAFVESFEKTDVFISDGIVSRVQPGGLQLPPGMQLPPQFQAQVQGALRWDSESWQATR